jgi:hypothetical protein
MSVIFDDTKIRLEIEEYNKLHQLAAIENYGITDEHLDNAEKLADEINSIGDINNIDLQTITDTVMKCLPTKQIKQILLNHELTHYQQQSVPHMSLEEFSGAAKQILDRYQCKAGGFHIEDTNWILHDFKSTDHVIKKHEIMFENSIDKLDAESTEVTSFLTKLHHRLSSVADNIKVDVRYKPSKHDGIVWIVIWCIDKELKKTRVKISL